MSASNDSTGDSDDGGPGRREVAHRIFAAEFDDASLSYSESDEERAPNYVVTPTGARVNRLFAVGVLTAVEAVNEETLRARIADPTGAFVSYAGQYQPDEMAFLDRTTPPAFLALTGKARTFEPEDSDRVFTSVRPESINEVDADTRDRWVVETARATLDRVRIFTDALETGLTGEDLRTHLESQDIPAALAAGIPLAIDHYGTTTAYLEAVRTLAVETLEVVADERDEATALDIAPDEGGDTDIGPLPAGDTDLSVDVEVESEASTEATADADETVEPDNEAVETATDDSAETVETTDGDDQSDEVVEATTTRTGEVGESSESSEPSESPESPSQTDETATAESSTADTATSSVDTATETATDDSTDELGDFGAGDESATETRTETGADDLGDFGTDTSTETTETETADTSDVDAEDIDDVLDDETREAVKSEHGVGFSTGNEVDDPGEAGIDVPDADELEEMAGEADSEPATESGESAEPTDQTSTTNDETTEESVQTEPTGDDETETADPEDVDLESAVLDAMKAEDGGDGAPREDVVSAVVAEYGVPEDAVEDAIQEALMSGLCYEAGDGLKPI